MKAIRIYNYITFLLAILFLAVYVNIEYLHFIEFNQLYIFGICSMFVCVPLFSISIFLLFEIRQLNKNNSEIISGMDKKIAGINSLLYLVFTGFTLYTFLFKKIV